MHQRIAEVLIEAHAHDPSSSVMPVAQHLLAAGELGDPTVLHEFFDAAGERAYAASAWAESAKYTEAAMRAAEQLAESTAAAKVTMSLRASRARLQSGEPQAARRNADAAIAALGANPSPESSAVVWIERLRADLFEPTPEVPIDTAPLEGLAAALDPASPGVARTCLQHARTRLLGHSPSGGARARRASAPSISGAAAASTWPVRKHGSSSR